MISLSPGCCLEFVQPYALVSALDWWWDTLRNLLESSERLVYHWEVLTSLWAITSKDLYILYMDYFFFLFKYFKTYFLIKFALHDTFYTFYDNLMTQAAPQTCPNITAHTTAIWHTPKTSPDSVFHPTYTSIALFFPLTDTYTVAFYLPL